VKITSFSALTKCHLLYDTWIFFALALVLAAEPAKPAPPDPKDPCCKEEAAAKPLSRTSLYQLEARFTDDNGRPVALASLRGRPVVFTMFFASCTYACPLLLSDMARIRELVPTAIRGKVAFVLVSFDPVRDTPAALHEFRRSRDLDAQWSLLHGDDSAVRELAALLGVKYKQEADGQFAHSNLITILNAEGEIVHQRQGLKDGHAEAAAALAAAVR
jgi:protein SCO1/2